MGFLEIAERVERRSSDFGAATFPAYDVPIVW